MDATLHTTLSDVLDPSGQTTSNDAAQSMGTLQDVSDADADQHMRVEQSTDAMDTSQHVQQIATPTDTTPATPAPFQSHPSPSHVTPMTKREKRPSSTPGSAADTRRREANRLAAERSRGRQQEKVVALEMAIQAMGDENLRLKSEIARLEGHDADADDASHAANSADPLLPDAAMTATAVVEAATAAAAAASDPHAQAESHSRNILAALLSAPGVPLDEALAAGLAAAEADSDTATWMHGVESLFKDADASGRLGELAAIAAGQGEGSPGANGSQHQQEPPNGDALHKTRSGTPSAAAYILAGASSIAAALNQELEKALREDLDRTRAAIDRVERECNHLRGQTYQGDDDLDNDVPLSLPPGLIEYDASTLRAHTDDTNAQIEKLEAETNVLREVVVRMMDAHAEDKAKVHTLAEEVRDLGMDGGEQEREKVTTLLKALRATVTNLMNAPVGEGNTSLMTPFSSPATARRRRGRPPKNVPNYLKEYSYQSDASAEPSYPEPKPRRSSARYRSRLANEIVTAETEAGPSNGTAEVDVHNSTSQPHAGPSNGPVDVAHNGRPTEQDTADAVGAAMAHVDAHNDYLLSHLTEAADDSRSIPLDSSSFAAFLPTPSHSSIDPTSLGPLQAQEEPSAQPLPEQPPNVLSRLKRGPPGSCDICGRTETTVWRKLNLAGEEHKVCNPCGLYHTKFGIIRPPELWGDGKSVKKRRTSSRPSGAAFDSPNGAKRKRKSGKFYDEDMLQQQAHLTNEAGLTETAPNAQSLSEVGRSVETMFSVV